MTTYKTLKDKVYAKCSETQASGRNILALGYEECNDFAQSVTNLLTVENREFIRFESVARYIRRWKAMENHKLNQF